MSIPKLYVLSSPPTLVVTFSACNTSRNVEDIGDQILKKGWHLNTLSGPAVVHIVYTQLMLQVMETFILHLKVSVVEAKNALEGKGTLVALYGGFLSFAHATPYPSLMLY